MRKEATLPDDRKPVVVWDLPTRLFHWMLVALVAGAFVTAKSGGTAMRYHMWFGSAVLALLLFRIVWGVIGSQASRFTSFLAGPGTVVDYARTLLRRAPSHHFSHNPLGGWSVAAMLLVLLVQAGTGLFSDDDIATAGPLAVSVSRDLSYRLTTTHLRNPEVIVALVALHIVAVLFHLAYKRENLITPMITGVKWLPVDGREAGFIKPVWWAAVAAIASAGAVYWLMR